MVTLHPSWLAVFGTTTTTNILAEDGADDGDSTTTTSVEISKATLTAAFGVCFVLGTAVGHLLLGVVASAVDTVLVTWAEAPLELERHYPGLYAAQVAAWRQAYPREFGM